MTIKEVSEKYGLSIDTLRYYERIGLIPAVKRTKGGIRDYGETECGWVEFVRCMRGAGLPIEVLIEYVTLYQMGDDTINARKDLLIEQRAQLAERIAEQQQILTRLDYKIEAYETIIVEREKELLKEKSE